MSKGRSALPPGQHKKSTPQGPALVVVISVAALAMLGYLVGELTLASRPHPFHWSIALAGALIGWAAGLHQYLQS